jgi:hypothetical protein
MITFEEYFKLIILNEFSEGAIKKIIIKFNNDASEEEIKRELNDFEKYKNNIEKKDPFQYKSWIEFTEAIHAAKGKAEFKNKKPVENNITANQDDILVDDENITIYKGDSQDKCVMYGQGYTFCISRQAGGNMFGNYRLGKDSTFYFIYFKNKPKSATDHIMVLDHTKNGYEWTFADNNTKQVGGGWDEIVSKYPELSRYKNILLNKTLSEEEKVLFNKLKQFTSNPNINVFINVFNTFSYKEKAQALKSLSNLPDEIWNTLDSTLRNEFLSVGPNLSDYQANNLKQNEIERYKKTRDISFKELAQYKLINVNKFDKIENIASKPYTSYQYAYNVLKGQNVPDEIMKSILSSPYLSYQYAGDVFKKQNVPDEIIKSIAFDPDVSLFYASDLLEGQNVPDEIMKSILSRPNTSRRYAMGVLEGQNVPDEIMKSIASDPDESYQYARDVLNGRNVPDEIMKSILSSPDASYQYARDVLEGQHVPDEIMKSIASDPYISYQYARDVLEGQNVPDEIMKSIVSDPRRAGYYAYNVLKGQNVPDELMKSIKSRPDIYYLYRAGHLKETDIDDLTL